MKKGTFLSVEFIVSMRKTKKHSCPTDLSGLEYCTNLTKLFLSKNQISTISPLVRNSGLGEGDEVWLEDNNPVLSGNSKALGDILVLKNMGVVVHY
ncbi:hypothetical protein ACFLTB_00600 [Chloroflexota bacterium]